jgi:hypothetical protein
MTLDYADVIPQVLCPKECSTAIHIKNRLLHSAFKVIKLPYETLFSDKLSIKDLYQHESKVLCTWT